jgi:hypothetical protein
MVKDKERGFMYGKQRVRFFLILLMVLLPFPLAAGGDWQKADEDADHGIVVYIRSVEGSPIKEYRGETSVEASLSALISLIADAEAFPEWMHNVRSAKVIEDINDTERITYIAQQVRWPAVDRDLVVYSHLSIDPETLQVTIRVDARPEAYPVQEGYVRIMEMKSTWQFTPIGNGRVSVVYETHVNPGGRIPPSVVNANVLDTPINSLRGLQEMIVKPKYRDAKLDIVDGN